MFPLHQTVCLNEDLLKNILLKMVLIQLQMMFCPRNNSLTSKVVMLAYEILELSQN